MQVILGSPAPIWVALKIFFVIGLAVYSIFALVVFQQTKIMSKTVGLSFELPIKILALLHLAFAIGLLIFALISL